MSDNRDNFSPKVKKVLAGRVSYLCSNPDCRLMTIGPMKGEDSEIVLGQAAHICAASPGGPRYNANMTPEQRRSYENGIWLCQKHAREVDSDKSFHTVELLHRWKKDAEEYSRNLFDGLSQTDLSSLTDDEQIVLFYLILNGKKEVKKFEMDLWLAKEEIRDFDFENARALLSEDSDGIDDADTISLKTSRLRQYLSKKEVLLSSFYSVIENHRKLASDMLEQGWNEFSDYVKLLLAFVQDEKFFSLGDRWRQHETISAIKDWENKEGLETILSNNYSTSLGELRDKEIIYAVEFTDYGNPRLYTFYPSALKYLKDSNSQHEFRVALDNIKKVYSVDKDILLSIDDIFADEDLPFN